MSTGVPSTSPLDILSLETPALRTAPGVSLSESQTTLLRSILDLFAGRPSLPKLALWRDDATLTDPLTIAAGRKKYTAQWYGLQKAFTEIERESHLVTDAGNPMVMQLTQRYVVKGLPGKTGEHRIQSVVKVWVDKDGKAERVEDRWGDKLPEGNISKAFRRLNAATMPHVVGAPKNV